jgi:cytoplasmic polyadenylation element-binding protein
MGDYSYGTSLSSVGHDSFSQSSQPIDTKNNSSNLYYLNLDDKQSTQSQPGSNGQALSQSSADSLSQNEEFINCDINSKGSAKSTQKSTQSSFGSSLETQNITNNSINNTKSSSNLSNMQNLDDFTRRLSKSSNKSDSDSNDKLIEGQIKASVNGNNGNNSGNSGGNGISGSDGSQTVQSLQTHLNAESSAVISSANEQQFWSTNCVTDSDVSQQPFISGVSANPSTALNGALQYPTYSSHMNTNFANTSSLVPQLSNLPQQQQQQQTSASAQRRAITGAHNFPQTTNRQQPQSQSSSLFKTYTSAANWTGSPQPSATSWSTGAPQASNAGNPWSSLNMSNQKRTIAGVPNMSPISPMKKSPPAMGQSTPSLMISPSKFRRSSSMPMGKPFPNNIASGSTPFDLVSTGSDTTSSSSESANVRDSNILLPFQERQMSGGMGSATSPLDTLRFPLEQQLLEIMRTTGDSQDHYKGFVNYNHNSLQSLSQLQGPSFTSFDDYSGNKKYFRARNFGRRRGKSPFFTGLDSENHILMDSNSGSGDTGERFSRKVFVGGLPPDIDEEEITASFRRFGPLVVDWPHKAESKSYFPPKGYAFLLFQDESSVQALIDACIQEDDKLYLCVSSPTIKDKPVQIRPWRLSDADFVLDASMPLDPRKTVFVGGVPRPLKAVELAMIMDRLYGGVCYAGIDTDPELRYPKGAGRVAFSNQQSYIAAISARFVQLQHGDIEKRVEVKPYVLDDQICDECQGARCGGKFAPFFCANVTCLQYYCEHCWATIHSRPGREFHKPLVKEGADRPRAVPFRWC